MASSKLYANREDFRRVVFSNNNSLAPSATRFVGTRLKGKQYEWFNYVDSNNYLIVIFILSGLIINYSEIIFNDPYASSSSEIRCKEDLLQIYLIVKIFIVC